MKAKIQRSACLLAAAVATPLAWAAPNMEEGNWEVTMKMEMAGMPMKMPPMVHNQCITKKNDVPEMAQRGQKCTTLEHNVVGNTVSWRMQCTGPEGTTDGEGKITYAGKTYEGAMKMTMARTGGQSMAMTYQMSGRHTGPCKEVEKKKDDY